MSGQVSYDVYVKRGVDFMGRPEFGEAVAHFVERGNAVALKRRLASRGETVHVERSIVHGLSEEEKERRFSDYSRIPEYHPPSDRAPRESLQITPSASPGTCPLLSTTILSRPQKFPTEPSVLPNCLQTVF